MHYVAGQELAGYVSGWRAELEQAFGTLERAA